MGSVDSDRLIVAMLREQQQEAAKLDAAIDNNLRELGFGDINER